MDKNMNSIAVPRRAAKLLKQLIWRASPQAYAEIFSARARRHSARLEMSWGCVDLTKKFIHRNGPNVLDGPFAGLRFSPQTFERHVVPKLLGHYERELHPAWREIIQTSYTSILDVGCAEGYYAVGLARQMPSTPIYAFDTDAWARSTTRQMANINSVGNVTVQGACTPQWLSRNLLPGSFVLCDCEGYEKDLLDPGRVPVLRDCDLLVELHEKISPGVTAALKARFSGTHRLVVIDSDQCDAASGENGGLLFSSPLSGFSAQERRLAVSEFRDAGQQWLYARKDQSELRP
jgi:hypothetical protein